jgi:alpha/beta superfamily hydrolase
VLAYAAIAYPFSVSWALTLFHQGRFLAAACQGDKPKLFIMGTDDNFTGIGAFRARVKAIPSPLEVVEVKAADHFFFGIEHKVCEAVHGWLQRVGGEAAG